MNYRFTYITFAAVLAMLLASPAFAEQTVTFSVPVHLSHMLPESQQFAVTCFVQNTKTHPGIWEDSTVKVPISNGKYDGVVHVQVPVPEDRVPKSKYWNCSLHLMRANSGLYCQLSPNAPQDECKVKPGAALVTHVSGTLRVRGRLPHTVQPRAGGFVRGK